MSVRIALEHLAYEARDKPGFVATPDVETQNADSRIPVTLLPEVAVIL